MKREQLVKLQTKQMLKLKIEQYIKGIIMGISYLIPGLCSASMSMVLGVYEVIIDIFGNWFKIKTLKKYLWFLLGMFSGCVLIIFLYNYLFSLCPELLLSLFLGIILGGFPIKEKEEERIVKHKKLKFIILFISALACILLIQYLGKNCLSVFSSDGGVIWYLYTLLMAFIASLALILPGISGAMILYVLGLYDELLKSFQLVINRLINFQLPESGQILFLLCFLGGFISGLWVFSKIIGKIIKTKPFLFRASANGFIFGSGIIIVIEIMNYEPNFIKIIISFMMIIIEWIISKKILNNE